jgi:hypothetical protein
MSIIYVLKLHCDKYYIGKTNNPDLRFSQHLNGTGCQWTRVYKPEFILDTVMQTLEFTELAVTLGYMKQYGIDNVRGSDYCSFYLSPTEKEEIQKHIRGDSNLCYTCGSDTHFTADCKPPKTFLEKVYEWFSCCKPKERDNYDYTSLNIVTFGKYKGKTYEQVLEKDKRYCNWVSETKSKNENFNKFKNWLNDNGYN